MPEGDTVWLAANTMDAALRDRILTASDLRTPELATTNLAGRRVREVTSYGKHLFTHFDDDRVLHTHFRMDGSWHLYADGARWRGGPTWQIRAILSTPDVDAVGYRIPVIELLTTAEVTRLIDGLGPDLIVDSVDLDAATRRCADQGDRPIGETLLDQRVVCGLGLIYVTESLYLHGVTPWTPVSAVEDLPRLLATASRLMRGNRNRYIQTTTGHLERDRWHYVYERSGRSCFRCGSMIAIARQGRPPMSRLAYWCPTCQSGPAPPPLSPTERRALRTQGRSRYRP